MTPFSATHQQGGTTPEATTVHSIAPAPELPAFTMPTFGLATQQQLPPAPRLALEPFALARHAVGSPHVEDGPVAFSIASTLLAADAPTPASAYDLDLASFAELQIDHAPAMQAAAAAESVAAPIAVPLAIPVAAPIAAPEAAAAHDTNATFTALATLAPMPDSQQASDVAFPATHVASGSINAEQSIGILLQAAVRARIAAFGRGPRHRSAHEWVFLMLAFAVMSLLAAPPLVAIFQALHGVKP